MLNKIINPIIELIISSPFHSLLSGSFMLITIKGRKSGKIRTFPVNYLKKDTEIVVFSRKGRSWWNNLNGGAPLEMLIKGKKIHGMGKVVKIGNEAIARELYDFYLNVAPRKISIEEALKKAPNMVLVKIDLDQ